MKGRAIGLKQYGVEIKQILGNLLFKQSVILVYITKVVLACLCALGLSLYLELEKPDTALMTVVIVMQARAGMVFAKSYYRLIGSLVGVLVSLILVALFAQSRELFLLAMAFWIGIATAGSMIFRNHQSYAFVLAGYTLCIVGLPAALSPEHTFTIATYRLTEILVGLFCATLVSDVVVPQRMWPLVQASIRKRFYDFSVLIAATSLDHDANKVKSAMVGFVGDVFNLESFSASSIFENDMSNQHRRRLNEMNHAFIEASTSLHVLGQLLCRMDKDHSDGSYLVLRARFQQLSDALAPSGVHVTTEDDARLCVERLQVFHQQFEQDNALMFRTISASFKDNQALSLEVGFRLIKRLADDLLTYAHSYACLSLDRGRMVSTFQVETASLGLHFDLWMVALAGVRGALALSIMSFIWINSDWPSGVEAISLSVVATTLFASAPLPVEAIKKFIQGAFLGLVLSFLFNFEVLPHVDGFWMLALAITPGIIIGAWLTTKPSTVFMGVGALIFYFLHAGISRVYSAQPEFFINSALADLLAIMVSGVLYGLIDMSTSDWSRNRVIRTLRQLIMAVVTSPKPIKRRHLERSARDLVHRAGSTRMMRTDADLQVIEWLFSVLEMGNTVIALRHEMAHIDHAPVLMPLSLVLLSIAQLYEAPSHDNRILAIERINNARLSLNEWLPNAQQKRHVTSIMALLELMQTALEDSSSVFLMPVNH